MLFAYEDSLFFIFVLYVLRSNSGPYCFLEILYEEFGTLILGRMHTFYFYFFCKLDNFYFFL